MPQPINPQFERLWIADKLDAELASEEARARIDRGEDRTAVLRSIRDRLARSWRVEDRSHWCDVIRRFVDRATIDDYHEMMMIEMMLRTKLGK